MGKAIACPEINNPKLFKAKFILFYFKHRLSEQCPNMATAIMRALVQSTM